MFGIAKRRVMQLRSNHMDRRAVRAEWDLSVGDPFGKWRAWMWEHDAMPRDELAGGRFEDPLAPPAAWSRRG